jgi:very-short-patch-repair endonuclease
MIGTELEKGCNFERGTNNKSKNLYSQKKLQFAKNLRHNQTDAEGLLWYYIRSKQLGGFKFKRQQIIGKYIVDFVCFEKELIIELDGSQHGEIDIIKSDKTRDDFLKYRGFKILRFWNEEIYKNCFEVLDFIYFQLKR